MLTDAWAPFRPPLTWLSRLNTKRKLTNRYHPDLAGAPVKDFLWESLRFEAVQKIRRQAGWQGMLTRNSWFQRQIVDQLSRLDDRTLTPRGTRPSGPPILFSFCYVALEPLRYAKKRGWRTVLDQIDPGWFEENLVEEENRREPTLGRPGQRMPAALWEGWRQEAELADVILVNSPWSFEALRRMDVPAAKLRIVPLAYESATGTVPAKDYPAAFTVERPMRVLFLGQIMLRKGVARLLRAARRLPENIELWMVGPRFIGDDPELTANPRIRWLGTVGPRETNAYYRQADVFILPTLSDGFALTQLEAVAQRLPVIVSRHCGSVVRDGIDGLVLPDVGETDIENALRYCAADPGRLAAFSAAAHVREEFGLDALAENLLALERSL